MNKIVIEPIFMTLAKGLSTPLPLQSSEKMGITNLKKLIAFAIKAIDEGSDLIKKRSSRKSLVFELLDLIPIATEGITFQDKMPIILQEIRDLQEEEVLQISNYLIAEIPYIANLESTELRSLIHNVVATAFAIYELYLSIDAMKNFKK